MTGAVLVGVAGVVAWLVIRTSSGDEASLPEIHEGAVLAVNPAIVRQLDHRLVHEELVPDWVRASGAPKALYWERLRREVASEPNLSALLDRMDALLGVEPAEHVDELRSLVQTYNDVMASADVDYRLAGALGPDGGWRLKVYRDLPVSASVLVDAARFGVTVRRRVDAAAPADAWMGQLHAHQDRVVVLLDRATSFTLDRVWPLLDPVLDAETDPLSARFGPAVRAEVAAALPPAAVEALMRTAEDRFWMLKAARSIRERHDCGSRYGLPGLPWNGLSRAGLHDLDARAAEGGACPEVTPREALIFAVRGMHVRRQEGVRDALEELVAFVSRAVVTHEARHAADLAAGPTISCRGCPEDLPPIATWEGSAYLATFARAEFAALALLQACAIDPSRQPERSSVIGFIANELVAGGCESTPPIDLADRARTLEAILFDRDDTITIEGFPARLPVSSEYGSR